VDGRVKPGHAGEMVSIFSDAAAFAASSAMREAPVACLN
jgi:hypothetical protein